MDVIQTASTAGTTIGIGRTAKKPFFLPLALSATKVLPVYPKNRIISLKRKEKHYELL